jgi:CHAD domain-containing protein
VFVRTARLSVAARMRTLRRPVELHDQAGGWLAEVVDDDVQVLDGRRIVLRFRELEAELAPDADAAVLEQVVDRLVQAGAQAAEPTPKYLRALGGRDRTLGPEVVEPEVGGDATVEALLRHDLAASTLRLFRHEPGVRIGEDPEAVHQARVATRRLRSTLRTFSTLLEPEWTDRLRDELKWLADLLGDVRDADVLLGRFQEHLAALPSADAKAGSRLLAGLVEQRERARRRLLRGLAEDRYAVLLDDLVAATAAPALLPGSDRPAAEVMPALVAKPWKRLRKAVAKAGDDPSDDELHQIRIRAKRARYAAEAVEPVIGQPAEAFADAAADLQDVLGDHHDAVVGEGWLRQAAGSARRDAALVSGLLVAAERASAATSREGWRPAWKALNRGKLRAWL